MASDSESTQTGTPWPRVIFSHRCGRKRETDSFGPTQDQNLRCYSDGVKTNESPPQKKRRALNDDISNPGKPSAEQQEGVKESSQGEQSISVVDEDDNSVDSLSDYEGLNRHDYDLEKFIEAQIATEKNYIYFSQAVQMFHEAEKELYAPPKANWMNAAISACMPEPTEPRIKPVSDEEYRAIISELKERKSEDLPGLGQNSPESPNNPGRYPI